MFSLFRQDSYYYSYFQTFCLNAKIIHAKFVTEKSNGIFKRENDKNKRIFRYVHTFFWYSAFRSILLFHKINQLTRFLPES